MRGWWNMPCWEGLSRDQQRRLVEHGNLPWAYRPEGECPRGAQVAIEYEYDVAPGPRFLCLVCAKKYLAELTADPL